MHNLEVLNKNTGEITSFNPIKELQTFIKEINIEPETKGVKINAMANNSKYLPISFIEMTLDELFFGLWNTKNFNYQVVANEIVGSIDLEYFHPVGKTWITRTGVGAVMIQQNKGSELTDYNSKIKNTLVKDFPHLKAECLKNAAKGISKLFGRDLNRKEEDEYTPFYAEYTEIEKYDWVEVIKNCLTLEELTRTYNELKNKDMKLLKDLTQNFTNQKIFIQSKANNGQLF